MKKLLTKYFEAVKFLESLNNLHHHTDLDRRKNFVLAKKRLKILLEHLGNPQDKIANYIHVSGTSGKGSVVHMWHEVLLRAGHHVGSTVSPHIQSTTERIKINHHYISAADFVRHVHEVAQVLEKILPTTPPLSYAEILFCLTIKALAEAGCDWAVIEVSCGGRTDFTNIIPAPRLAIVTNIGHDHFHLIGPRLADVAREKAGIIKPGCLFLSAERDLRLRRILLEECRRQNVESVFVDHQSDHRDNNANLVRLGAERLGIPTDAVTAGIAHTHVPARFEVVQTKPLVIIDGAHNPEKMRATAQAFARLAIRGKRRLIISMSSGKNIMPMLKHIIPLADDLIITRHANIFRKSIEPRQLFRHIKTLAPHLQPRFILDARAAYETMAKKAKPNDGILVTGSLFTAGEIRDIWFPREKIIVQKTSFPK